METLNIKQLKQENKLAFKELYKDAKYSIQTYLNNNKEICLAIIFNQKYSLNNKNNNPKFITDWLQFNDKILLVEILKDYPKNYINK